MVFARAFSASFMLCCALNGLCFGSEVCHLANGFQIEAVSHTQDHDHLILRTANGSLEFPLSEVAKIDIIPDRTGTHVVSDSSAAMNSLTAEQALQNAAEAQGLPAAFVRSVARTESGYNQKATSEKGAIGLMQLMPATAAALGVKPALLEENAQGGAKYLRDLLVRYKGNAVFALAAYNAGPNAVNRYGGLPPYTETRRYVENVLREYARQQSLISLAKPVTAKPFASKPTAKD